MLYELINKIDMRMLRLKLCLFLISSLMLLITPVKRIDDMSQIIELYWICLEDIKIFVCIVFQIILITINLSLLLTKDSILLQVLVFESWLLEVQHLDFILMFSMGYLVKYWLLIIFELFIIIWRILLDSLFAF